MKNAKRTPCLTARAVAALVVCALALPGPALALRGPQPEAPAQRGALKRAITAGLEEVVPLPAQPGGWISDLVLHPQTDHLIARATQLAPDGSRTSFQCWDIRKGSVVSLANEFKVDVAGPVAVSRDHSLVAWMREGDRDVHLRDVSGKESFQPLRHRPEEQVRGIAIGPDGDKLVTWGFDSKSRPKIWVWKVDEARRITELAPSDPVGKLLFNPDGDTLAVAFARSVRLWSISKRKGIALLAGHPRGLRAVAFARPEDGGALVTTGIDPEGCTLKVWDTARSAPARVLPVPAEPAWLAASAGSLSVGPGARVFALGDSRSNRVVLWAPEQLKAEPKVIEVGLVSGQEPEEAAEEETQAGGPERPVENLLRLLESENPEDRAQAQAALQERYSSYSRQAGEDLYARARYFSEVIAGVPFPADLDQEDFTQAALLLLHERLSRMAERAQSGSEPPYAQTYLYGSLIPALVREVLAARWGAGQEITYCLERLREVAERPSGGGADALALPPSVMVAELEADKKIQQLAAEIRRREEPLLGSDPRLRGARPERIAGGLEPSQEDLAALELANEDIDKVLKTLSYREREIIKLRYGLMEGYSYNLKEVADIFKITRARVGQIEHHALRKLTHPSRAQQLAGYATLETGGSVRPPPDQLPPVPSGFEPGSLELAQPGPRTRPWTAGEEDELLDWIGSLSIPQRRVLPYVVLGMTPQEIALLLKAKEQPVALACQRIRSTLRVWFSFGLFDRFGTPAEVAERIAMLAAETELERVFRRARLDELLVASRGDVVAIEDLILQTFPERFKEREVHRLVQDHFQEVSARIQPIQAGVRPEPGEVLRPVRELVRSLLEVRTEAERERRKRALARLLRDLYYPVLAADDRAGTRLGLDALSHEIARAGEDASWQDLLQQTREYYAPSLGYHPRGFQEAVEGVRQPLLLAQRCSVWHAVRTLEGPERGALISGEARVAKTIVAILAAFNVRDPETGKFVSRVLYTAPRSALYEVALEAQRRTDQELELQVVVVDRERGSRAQQIRDATRLADEGKNVLLVANYESERDLARRFRRYKPQCHIIDEIDNLRHRKTVRAPIILGIPAKYHIGVGARLVVNRPANVVEPLLWVRHQQFTPAEEARTRILAFTPDELFSALDPVMTRWRRRVVIPEVGDPRQITEVIPYGPQQDRVVQEIRQDFVGWKQQKARPDLVTEKDSLFNRFDTERRASVDLGLVLPDAQFILHPEDGGEPQVLWADQNQVSIGGKSYERVLWKSGRTVQLRGMEHDEVVTLPLPKLPMEVTIGGRVYRVEQQDLMDLCPKIQRLDQIIEEERRQNGKVLVLVDFVEGVDRLEARYQRRLGVQAAAGVSGKYPLKERMDRIWAFRSEAEPVVLIGTPYLLGSALNLFQIPNRPFHISTVVRMSRPWVNMDDGERLIGIGQTYPVRVITLVSQFREIPESTMEQILETKLAGERQIFTRVVDGKPILEPKSLKRLETLKAELDKGLFARALPPKSGAGLEEERAGLEEAETSRVMAALGEATTEDGVVVIGPEALEAHAGLEEFLKRAPPPLAQRLILHGVQMAVLQRIRAVNPAIRAVESGDFSDLVALLLALPEAERVTVLSWAILADQLRQVMPVEVTHLERAAALRVILAAAGVYGPALDQVDLDRLERFLARLQST